jgi:2-polyprenyl-6-methoxyphenol hydroxylase-like FAD-dependent oxidoreductase
MKAIICGAGVAGLTLAARLGAAGWRVVLLERAAGLPGQSYMIDFFGLGYAAAERLNLIGRLREVSYDIPQIVWLNQTGAPVARLHYSNVEHALRGKLITLMRGDLARTLFATVTRSTEVRFGQTIGSIHLGRGRVEVGLSDGSREIGDLLVGADGIHSRVRELLLGDAESAFQYLGLHAASYVFEDAAIHDSVAGQFVVMSTPGRQAGFYPLRGGLTAAFFSHRMPSAALPSSAAGALSDTYKSFGSIVPSALEHARSLSNIFYDSVGQIRLSRWCLGRVALLGDACQAVSLVAGQGASLAVHAACVLADELTSTDQIHVALERYEQRLKPVVRQIQMRGRLAAQWFVPSTRLRLGVRNAAVRMVDHRSMNWMLRPLLT